MSNPLTARLELALDAAREAEQIILSYYQRGVHVDRKRDSSPVTIADRSAEEAIRKQIATHFGDDAVLGEEFGETAGTSGYRWILDPLDGTKSFIHGTPLFGTLIGLEHEGKCVVGVCHFPVLGETVWAARGSGAWWKTRDQQPIPAKVSGVSTLADSLFSFTTVQGFGRIGRVDAFDELIRQCGLSRGWGDCYGHALVATGRAEVMVDPLMNPWDIAALVPIVEEAGGHFMSWAGTSDIHAGNGISVNAALRDQILAITQTAKPA
jgi:histidinol-phosphatase